MLAHGAVGEKGIRASAPVGGGGSSTLSWRVPSGRVFLPYRSSIVQSFGAFLFRRRGYRPSDSSLPRSVQAAAEEEQRGIRRPEPPLG